MTTFKTPLGIIEGFFGREWSWNARFAYPEFLANHGFDFYIYAPKGDRHLRKDWCADWPIEVKAHLQSLSAHCRKARIKFGVGLSPYEYYLHKASERYRALTCRIKQINELSPEILCILFDDMRGDLPELAEIQVDAVHLAAEHCVAKKIIFCPTYYSFDPVLEKVFGTMPEKYWHQLSTRLDNSIDIFWTGEKVCSETYPSDHLKVVSELLGRKPFLWDNYPVNDGASKSNFLNLAAVNKSHALLDEHVAGHAVNPMNQAWLSQIPLASLPRAYKEGVAYDPDQAFLEIAQAFCGADFAAKLCNDLSIFQTIGLQSISPDVKLALIKKYEAFSNTQYAAEIVDWLNGEYRFDPACLTG